MLAFALLAGANNLLYVLLFASLHETGHIFILYLLKGKADEVKLSYYGIGLKHSFEMSRGREAVFLLGGCAVNALFCVLNIKRDINLPLLIMNILPVYPLDGGRLLKLFTGIHIKVFLCISSVVLISLLTISIYYNNLNLLLITVYLAVFSYNEEMK